jgi:hypothetical protein
MSEAVKCVECNRRAPMKWYRMCSFCWPHAVCGASGEVSPVRELKDCLDCDNPFCSGGRCVEQLHAEARRRDAMWKEVGP